MDPDPLASAETITLLRRFSAVVDTNRIFGHYGIVAKRKTVAYRATEKASPYWIKIKNPNYSQAEGRDELFNPKSDGIIQISGPPSNGLIAEFIRRESYSH